MGFLNDLFGSKKRKASGSSFDERKMTARMEGAGLSVETRLFYAEQFDKEKPAITFDGLNRKFFSDADEAAMALRICRPFIESRPLASLSLKGLYSEEQAIMGAMDIHAEEVRIENCHLQASDWKHFPENLRNGGVRKLILEDIQKVEDPETKNEEHLFLEALPVDRLEELTFYDSELRDADFSALAAKIASSSLTKLNLGRNYARDEGLIDVIKALPDSLNEFNLERTPIGERCGGQAIIQALADRVKTMPNLETLTLSECELGPNDINVLMPVLPPTLKTFDIGNNRLINGDDALKTVTEHLRHPLCRVTTTYADTYWASHFSPEVKAEFKQAEENNRTAALLKVQKEKAVEIARAKGEPTPEEKIAAARPEELKGMLHMALRGGVIEVAFDRMKKTGMVLTADDLNGAQDGKTFVQACIDAKKIHELMQPELYNNAKEYQGVYNALPETGKAAFDGKDGRPNFMKMKNQVMSTAVKAAMAQKIRKAR